ncbi:GPI-anchored wall transfer protein 1, putative [Plasmodium chabaudi adami]|uniref:GPI-anchored wall transfer protein 1, putative n=1 Tax=Plasmodium chabaudi adami TaxID=5826 RepID=A0A1D3S1B7_PLACE|nr:GPI-anchored wall transfer protein 1, putative [Plasmodium chabaudi adami]
MNKVNLISYLFICPLNVTHILDSIFYMHEINKNVNSNNDLFTYDNNSIHNGGKSLYHDKQLHEVSELFFQLSQKYKPYFEDEEQDKLNIVEKKKKKNNDDIYKFKDINIHEEEIYFLYENVKTKEVKKIQINKTNKVNNYLNLLKNDNCIYKLNTIEYKKIKNIIDHSNDIVVNTYYIYLLLLFFSLCIYIEKSLFIIFPMLRKWEIIMTLFIILVPSIIYLFFYFYFTITNVISLYIFCYLLFYAYTHKWKNNNKLNADDKTSTSESDFVENKKNSDHSYNCLIHTRLINMCITYLCIFAVDFFYFPKHFKKSAYYGNTLMDLGIGACITTSAYCYKKKNTQMDMNSGKKECDNNIKNDKAVKYTEKDDGILKIIMKYFILFIFGVGRFFAITIFNYNYSITEYGIHWNFYMTLFFLLIITDIIFNILKNKKNRIFIFSCISICIYELFIHIFDIHSYILFKGERKTFFEANKEGIFNLIGSINLYTFSYSFWNLFIINHSEERLKNNATNCELSKKNNQNLCEKSVFNNSIYNNLRFIKDKYYNIYLNIKIFFFAFLFYIFHSILNKYGKYSVRVLCNANYIFIMTSISLFMAGLSYFIEQIITEKININILNKINYNTLLVFLFCNITLGLFNILFHSLLYPLILSLFILILYSLFFLIFAKFLPVYSRRKS